MPLVVWLGVMVGAVLGIGYGLWQRWSLRSGGAAAGTGTAFVGAAVRLSVLVLALWWVLRYTPLNRLAVLGGLAVAYAGVLAWSLASMWTRKK